MGDVYKSHYTAPIPDGATVCKGVVTWTDKRGKKKTGKLSGKYRVLIETSKYVARYRDEHGKERKVSTGCTSKETALHFLRQREMEVERIRAGLMTREEINSTQQNDLPLVGHIDAFDQSRTARGLTERQIQDVRTKLTAILSFIGARNLLEITRDGIERYIVHRMSEGRSPQTINNDLSAVKAFGRWCVETNRLKENPATMVKKLPIAGQLAERRAFTDDEIERLFWAVDHRRVQSDAFREERKLIYETMLGTGFRTSELAAVMVHQVHPTYIELRAPDEKARRGVRQPILPDLYAKLSAWIEGRKKSKNDHLFVYTKKTIEKHFVRDRIAADIPYKDDRGHLAVMYSLRHTYGTRLARAGVPLTTTQRLMRHSTPELTAKYYIDVTPIDMMDALKKMGGATKPHK